MFRPVVVMSLLIPAAVAGCQSTTPCRSLTGHGVREQSRETVVQPSSPTTVAPDVKPVDHEQPESLPAPSAENGTVERSLTLTDLEAMAFRHNPTLAAAAARIRAAGGRRLQAGLYPNPVVGYHATEIGNLGTAGQQGGFVSQRFVTGGKLGLDQAIAEKEVDEARIRLEAQEQRLLSDVRSRFCETLVAQRRVELAEELAGIGDELVRATEKLLASRLAAENDLLQAQVRADEAHILRENAENQHDEAWRRLSAVIGLPRLETTRVDGRLDAHLPSFDWTTCREMVLANNPELRAARVRAERARFALRRARQEPIPDVDLLVSVRHHNVSEDEVVNVQAGIPLPVFDRNQGNIRSAEADWGAARREIGRVELGLHERLASVYRRYASARQRVDRYGRRIVPRARKSLDLVTGGYGQGQVEYLTLLTAQQTYVQVSLSYLDSLRELWEATAVIEGQLLSGSLGQCP